MGLASGALSPSRICLSVTHPIFFMSTTQTDRINNLIVAADSAATALESARRQVSADYSERARKMRNLKAMLHAARRDPEAKIDSILTPELAGILSNPTRDL